MDTEHVVFDDDLILIPGMSLFRIENQKVIRLEYLGRETYNSLEERGHRYVFKTEAGFQIYCTGWTVIKFFKSKITAFNKIKEGLEVKLSHYQEDARNTQEKLDEVKRTLFALASGNSISAEEFDIKFDNGEDIEEYLDFESGRRFREETND